MYKYFFKRKETIRNIFNYNYKSRVLYKIHQTFSIFCNNQIKKNFNLKIIIPTYLVKLSLVMQIFRYQIYK